MLINSTLTAFGLIDESVFPYIGALYLRRFFSTHSIVNKASVEMFLSILELGYAKQNLDT